MLFALSSSPSLESRSTNSSEMPRAFRSCRILAEPYLRESERVRSSAKRSSDCCFFDSSESSTASSACGDSACRASLRASSARECSRRTRYLSARAFSSAGESAARESAAGSPDSSALTRDCGLAVAAAPLAGRQLLDLLVFDNVLGDDRGDLAARLLADLGLDLFRERGIFLEEIARVVLALAEAVAVVDVPGAGFLEHAVEHADLQHLAFARDALAVQDVELGLPERRRDLVLHHLHAGLGAGHLVALLDRADAADVHAHRGVELERVAAGAGFRVAEHDADLHADLVDEDDERIGALDVARELAQRLAHEARLQAHLWLAHLSLALR